MSERLRKKNQIQPESVFDEKEVSFADILIMLSKNIKIILILPFTFCTLMIIKSLFFEYPLYLSSAKIMSSNSNGAKSQASGIAARFGISLPNTQSEQKWAYPEIIKSRTIARSMLKRIFDTEKFGPQKSLLQIFNQNKSISNVNLEKLEILAVNDLINRIHISEDKLTSILTVGITAFEPSFAKNLTSTLIEEIDNHQKNYNKGKTSETKIFIQGRIIDTEKELVVAEERLKIFRDRNRRIENSPSLLLEQQRLNREVTVLTGVFTTLKQQLETTKIEEVRESDYVIIIDPPELPISRSNIGRKKRVFFAGIFGISLGILFAMVREFLRNNNQDEKEKIIFAKGLFIKNLSYFIPKKIINRFNN
jgi:uncharacterized protein involved in exopolysaccharide biosynthesis